jgi:hypothetical protein
MVTITVFHHMMHASPELTENIVIAVIPPQLDFQASFLNIALRISIRTI